MTREEAIDTLNAIQALMKIYPKRKKQKEAVTQFSEAIDMAIQSLNDWTEYSDKLWKIAHERGKADAQKWIPCSEKLPSESGTYLTTTAKGAVCTDHYYANSVDIGGRHWSYHRRREPVAWMPLPEPYKAESEDEE